MPAAITTVSTDLHTMLKQAKVIRLSLTDQECFAQALLSPPQPAPALQRAFARRSKLLRGSRMAHRGEP